MVDIKKSGTTRIFLSSLIVFLFLFVGVSCKSTKKVQRRPSGKGRVESVLSTKGLSSDRSRIVKEAEGWIGVPYRYGGNDKREGTDCSGMVLAIYRDAAGIKLPRNSAQQSEFCRDISERDVKPGDLIFFATGKDPERVSHVGILIGGTEFIHSSTSKGVVVSDYTASYYRRTFRGFGRVPGMK